MLKIVEKQLILIFLLSIFVFTFSSLVYFYLTKRKEGYLLATLSLSVAEMAFVLILIFLSNISYK